MFRSINAEALMKPEMSIFFKQKIVGKIAFCK